MAKRKRRTKKVPSKSIIRVKPGISIGAPAAEQDDEFLSNCFVELPAVEYITSTNSNRSILLARTGAGKSAILLHISKTKENVTFLDPKDASFDYVSSSNMLQTLASLGVDMHIFYEYLWKHIICIHVIRHVLGVRTDDKIQQLFRQLEKLIKRDNRKEIVWNYLKRWENNFWVDVDEVSREVIHGYKKELAATCGISIDELDIHLNGLINASQREIRQFKNRAQRVVNSLQIKELNETISALSELIGGTKRRYYILIDNLDRPWVNEEHQYPLIRALIDCLQTFGRVQQVRIVIAMREDLYEAVIQSTRDPHFQSEKMEGLIVRIRWTNDLLGNLINSRISYLFESVYTKKDVQISDVFPQKIGREQIEDFLITRTLRRPRDIIAFVRVRTHKRDSLGVAFVIHSLRRENIDESRLFLADRGAVCPA